MKTSTAKPKSKQEIQTKTEVKSAEPETGQTHEQRKYRGADTVHHDLYLLSTANCVKDLGWDPNDPQLHQFPHAHYFHTVDSDGRKQTRSTANAGHSHEIKVIPGKNPGDVPNVICGPPLKEVRRRIGSKWKKAWEPLSEDDHTHQVIYQRSHDIAVRKPHQDAANVIARDAAKTAPIPGVIG